MTETKRRTAAYLQGLGIGAATGFGWTTVFPKVAPILIGVFGILVLFAGYYLEKTS